jgi:hypothetical protein
MEALLEVAGQRVMTANLDDLRGLGAIDAAVEALAGLARTAGRPVTADLSLALVGLLDKTILDEVNEGDPLRMVTAGIALLQRVHRDWRRTGKENVDDPELGAAIARWAATDPTLAPVIITRNGIRRRRSTRLRSGCVAP